MYLKQLVIQNVRRFRLLDLDFERPHGSFAGWSVFVGGNGSGKSTLLKSIALALMGPEAGLRMLGPADAWSGWLRYGEDTAAVVGRIIWDADYDLITPKRHPPGKEMELGVRWHKGQTDRFANFTSVSSGTRVKVPPARRGPWNPNNSGWFSAGYGPMRRLTGSSTDAMRDAAGGGVVGRFVTLFREDAALSESELWLKDIQSRSLQSDEAASSYANLKDSVCRLLEQGLLPHGLRVHEINRDHVSLIDANDVVLPLRDLSDGCRGAFALMLDLVHQIVATWPKESVFNEIDGRLVVDRPGIVLIDELEAHLHPLWQQQIADWMKTHFPKVQFLVTTHSPLIAQAADPNGVFVLPLQNEESRSARRLDKHEYEKIKLGKAEKVLLGAAFGLHSTRSKWANDRIAEWQRLNAKRKSTAPLKPDEERKLKVLDRQMELAFEVLPE